MTARSSIGLVAAVALGCTGCVYVPPSPPSVALPPPTTAQADAPPQQQSCREFRQTITIGQETKEGWGTTCQQPDGTWRVVTPQDAAPSPPEPAQVAVAPAYPAPAYPVYPAYPAYAYPPYPYYYPPPIAGSVFIGGRWRWR